MADRYFLYQGGYHALPEEEPLPPGAIAIPRLPDVGETWNAVSGTFRKDNAVAADMGVPADHKERAHILKSLEASVILSGFLLDHGLIAEEARALGISTAELARQVAQNDAEFRAREIARRITKTS